jgi:hypothetical protein
MGGYAKFQSVCVPLSTDWGVNDSGMARSTEVSQCSSFRLFQYAVNSSTPEILLSPASNSVEAQTSATASNGLRQLAQYRPPKSERLRPLFTISRIIANRLRIVARHHHQHGRLGRQRFDGFEEQPPNISPVRLETVYICVSNRTNRVA